MSQTLTLKLKPYLQEFLICKLADEASVASSKNLIGAILGPLIEYAPKDYVFTKKSGPTHITFKIPQNLNLKDNRGNIYISNANQKNFERTLKLYFTEIFIAYVNDKIRFNNEIKKSILMFCTDYNISFTHITYEMLKKKYYRFQTKKNKKYFPQNFP